MSFNENTNRLGRRPGEKGPRTPVESAGLDKSLSQTTSQKNSSPTSSPPKRKRKYQHTTPLPIPEKNQNNLETWPHFFVLHSLDPSQPLSALSPFKIWNEIIAKLSKDKEEIQKPKKMSKLASGDYLAEVDKQTLSQDIRLIKTIQDIPISVIPHKTLNSSKGIIKCRDISMCSEEEILENLLDQGVCNVKRIRVKRNGSLVATHTYILEFKSIQLPEAVFMAYIKTEVEEYVPNPLRCYKCQLFGHHKDRCSKPAVCGNCGTIHDENPCPNPPSCINCHEKHPASDRNCPKWKTEKEILAVRNRYKISHPEARKIVEARTPSDKSYAKVVKLNTTHASTQTDACPQTDASPFLFESNSKYVTKTIVKSAKPSPKIFSHPTQTDNQKPECSSFQPVKTNSGKWKKGVNSPKTHKAASPARVNPVAATEALLAQNPFAVLADPEAMEIGNSRSSPSPSPRSASRRSPNRGATSGSSQTNSPLDSSRSSQGKSIPMDSLQSTQGSQNHHTPMDSSQSSQGKGDPMDSSQSSQGSQNKPGNSHTAPDKPPGGSQEKSILDGIEPLDYFDGATGKPIRASIHSAPPKPPIPKKPPFSFTRVKISN
jgi:hypothetical protein